MNILHEAQNIKRHKTVVHVSDESDAANVVWVSAIDLKAKGQPFAQVFFGIGHSS